MNDSQQIQIIISKQALERAAKDKFIKQNHKWYDRQITILKMSLLNRPTERIGDFNVTPRGNEKRRIAWHLEIRKNIITIFIVDLLYHITESKYIDNWNIKAATKQITLKDYGPYLPFTNL